MRKSTKPVSYTHLDVYKRQILKRLFFSAFYKFPKPQNNENVTTQKTKKNLDSKLNWDAETVDYEEVKDEKTSER